MQHLLFRHKHYEFRFLVYMTIENFQNNINV